MDEGLFHVVGAVVEGVGGGAEEAAPLANRDDPAAAVVVVATGVSVDSSFAAKRAAVRWGGQAAMFS